MNCPVCEEVDLSISSREGVEIDYCPRCRGVWLDRGELDKIIDRVLTASGGQPQGRGPQDRPRDDQGRGHDRGHDGGRDRGHDDRSGDQYRGKKKKKSRFESLGDLFDF